MEITRNKENLLKICRGGVTQWEKPIPGMLLDSSLSVGTPAISGFIYLKGAEINVKVERGKEIVFDETQKTYDLRFTLIFKDPLKDNDKVMVYITAPYYRPFNRRYLIYGF